MATYQSNQEFYDDIDSAIEMMRHEGFNSDSEEINFLLHKVAWTTNSELFGDLRNKFISILEKNSDFPVELRDKLRLFIATINVAEDRANGKI